jgi:hypothetical protein
MRVNTFTRATIYKKVELFFHYCPCYMNLFSDRISTPKLYNGGGIKKSKVGQERRGTTDKLKAPIPVRIQGPSIIVGLRTLSSRRLLLCFFPPLCVFSALRFLCSACLLCAARFPSAICTGNLFGNILKDRRQECGGAS